MKSRAAWAGKKVMPRALLLAGAFVFAQLLTQIHGAQSGFDPHSHDGIACQVAVVTGKFVAIEPGSTGVPVPPSAYSLIAFDQSQETAGAAAPVATSARGPPLLLNVV